MIFAISVIEGNRRERPAIERLYVKMPMREFSSVCVLHVNELCSCVRAGVPECNVRVFF